MEDMTDRTQDYVTLTVIGSNTAFHPDGTTALVLHTQERGAIAFRIDLHAIETLRQHLATAETFLRQPSGRA
jgi:hypothetical protein